MNLFNDLHDLSNNTNKNDLANISHQELQELFSIIDMFRELYQFIPKLEYAEQYENLLFEGFNPQDWRYKFCNLLMGYGSLMQKHIQNPKESGYYINKYRKMLNIYQKRTLNEILLKEMQKSLTD